MVRQYLRLAAVLLATAGLTLLASISSCQAPNHAAGHPPRWTAAPAATALPVTALPVAVVKAAAPRRAGAISAGLCAGHRALTAVEEGSASTGFAPQAGTGDQPQHHKLSGTTAPKLGITAPGRTRVAVMQPLPRDQFPGLLRV